MNPAFLAKGKLSRRDGALRRSPVTDRSGRADALATKIIRE
jgi:hypothetical protein